MCVDLFVRLLIQSKLSDRMIAPSLRFGNPFLLKRRGERANQTPLTNDLQRGDPLHHKRVHWSSLALACFKINVRQSETVTCCQESTAIGKALEEIRRRIQ